MSNNSKEKLDLFLEDFSDLIRRYEIRSPLLSEYKTLVGYLEKIFIEKTIENEQNYFLKETENISNRKCGKLTRTVFGFTGKHEIIVQRYRLNPVSHSILDQDRNCVFGLQKNIDYFFCLGIPVGKISRILKDIYGLEMNKNLYSKMTDHFYEKYKMWNSRELENKFVAIFIDGINFFVQSSSNHKKNRHSQMKTIYIAIGVTVYGEYEVLVANLGKKECLSQWTKTLRDIKKRGVTDVDLVVSDNFPSITNAIHTVFPRCKIQKCFVHHKRQFLKTLTILERIKLNKILNSIIDLNNVLEAKKLLMDLYIEYQFHPYISFYSWMNNFDELILFLKLPKHLRRKFYSTNIIERLNHTIREFTKHIGCFKTDRELMKLVYVSILKHQKSWNKEFDFSELRLVHFLI